MHVRKRSPTTVTRRCLDCHILVMNGSRCPTHERVYRARIDANRGSAEARGYGREWRRLSRAVLKRDGYVCAYCGGRANTADHIVPKARGGTDDPSNLVAACGACNSAKGARVLSYDRVELVK